MTVAIDRTGKEKLIIASHFLPTFVKVKGRDGNGCGFQFENRRDHAALYEGIRSLKKIAKEKYSECITVGHLGTILEEDKSEKNVSTLDASDITKLKQELWSNERQVPVLLDQADAYNHYEGYCKKVLWPFLHYIPLPDEARPNTSYWKGYIKVNEAFADVIAPLCESDTIVWINDYHLLLLPKMLRERVKNIRIGLFFHITFPSFEIFRSLPERVEILEGMLHSNTIGFQTFSYSRHFCSSCTRILGVETTPKGVEYNNTFVSLEIVPIGINVEELERVRKQPSVLEKERAILKMFEGKKIIVGRDKMDTVSGITHKLDAFECFLKEYPEWRNKVVLVQISQPGQIRDAKLEAKISERVTQINSIYGSLEFVPVHFHRTYIENDKYLALLNIADLGLIMSVRSGMNTVSLEYIACQNEKHSPLILSEFTGTAGSMCGAIQTNPWNMYSVASSINKALLMSEVEKEQRHKQMYAYVYSHNSELWASSFINSIRKNFAQYDISNTKELDRLMISSRYRTSSKRLLLLDYDGTLTPITNIPSMALLDEETVHTLASLCKDERNTVWVISGRDIEFLDKHMGHIKGLGMSGEHGGFIRNPHGEWISLVERLDLSWMPKIKSIFEFYTERTKGSFIEEKKAAITWHYRNADPEYGTFQCNQCMDYLEGVIASNMPVEVVVGKKCLEVRPSVVNKGEIVSRILNSNPSDSPYDFVFVAGDDRTDEDMFKAINDFVAEQNQIPSSPNLLPNNTSGTLKPCMSSASLSQSLFQPDAADQNYFTVLVGPPNKKTSAAWSVRSSKELTDFFATLT